MKFDWIWNTNYKTIYYKLLEWGHHLSYLKLHNFSTVLLDDEEPVQFQRKGFLYWFMNIYNYARPIAGGRYCPRRELGNLQSKETKSPLPVFGNMQHKGIKKAVIDMNAFQNYIFNTTDISSYGFSKKRAFICQSVEANGNMKL